jgi:hypothetical protein
MTLAAVLASERPGSKVGDRHRERLAVVYVRQSTRRQVVDHQESTRLQNALVERAVGLGWPAGRVVVIDEDLGKSAASATGRAGSSAWSPRSPWGTWACAGYRDVAAGPLGN